MTELRKTMEPVAWRMRDDPTAEWNTANRSEKVDEAWVKSVGFAFVEPLCHITDADRDRILALEAENKRLRAQLDQAREMAFDEAARLLDNHAYQCADRVLADTITEEASAIRSLSRSDAGSGEV